jgi:restriction endonuclease S subunit
MYDTAAFKMSILDREAAFNQAVCGIKPSEDIDLYFLMLFFIINKEEYLRHRVGVRQRNLSKGFISEIQIPKIPLKIQKQIVSQIEKEQALVNGNKQLINLFKQKIKDRIEKVWGK